MSGTLESSERNLSRFTSDFKEVEKLGQGGFGVVYKARHSVDKELYAVKKIKIRAKDRITKLLGEVKMLTKLENRNIVRYHSSWIENDIDNGLDDEETDDETEEETDEEGDNEDEKNGHALGITGRTTSLLEEASYERSSHLPARMEYCGTHTLRSYIDTGVCQNKSRRMKIFKSLLDGLEYIHSQGIIHRDLKPENVFIDKDKTKIGDFGLATRIRKRKRHGRSRKSSYVNEQEMLTTNIGSFMYVCPEMLCNKPKSKYGQEVDIYSLGIIFFEMSYRPLTTGMERFQILVKLRSPDVVFPEDFEMEVTVLRDMLNHNPKERPSAKAIKRTLSTKPSSNIKVPGKKEFLYALINCILYNNVEPEMYLKDIEENVVRHFNGVANVSTFSNVCETTLRCLLLKKPELYQLRSNKGTPMVRLKSDVDLVTLDSRTPCPLSVPASPPSVQKLRHF